MSILKNTTPMVEAIGKIEIIGNVIPPLWYKNLRIVKKTKNSDSDKPYLLAIVILSDIVYWYKPSIVRDEQTSAIIEIKKKFQGDKLQRNPYQIANTLGVSKTDASEALRFLCKMGLIDTELRIIVENGRQLSNVMFIGINAKRIEQISHSELTPTPQLTTTPTPQLTTTPTPQLTGTYTENKHTKIKHTKSEKKIKNFPTPTPQIFSNELEEEKTGNTPTAPPPSFLKDPDTVTNDLPIAEAEPIAKSKQQHEVKGKLCESIREFKEMFISKFKEEMTKQDLVDKMKLYGYTETGRATQKQVQVLFEVYWDYIFKDKDEDNFAAFFNPSKVKKEFLSALAWLISKPVVKEAFRKPYANEIQILQPQKARYA